MNTIEPDHVPRRKVYDSRVREAIRATSNANLFQNLNIPKSTLRGWINGEFKTAVGAESVSRTETELYAEIAKLWRRVRVLHAVMSLLLALNRVTGCRLDGGRLPDGAAKDAILKTIGKASKVFALASVLRVIGISKSRYHVWERRGKACDLTDRSSCPKKSPSQLTPNEIENIRQMATSDEYRHMPTSTLSRFAQRADKVYASAFRTPDEVYFGRAEEVPIQLTDMRAAWHAEHE